MPAKKPTSTKPSKPTSQKPKDKASTTKVKAGKKGQDEDLEGVLDDGVDIASNKRPAKPTPKGSKQSPRLAPVPNEDDDLGGLDEEESEDEDDDGEDAVPKARGRSVRQSKGKAPVDEDDELGEPGDEDTGDEDVETDESEDDEGKDVEEIEEKIPCDFCTKNSTHACFNCGKNGCDEHVLSVMVWVKKGKGRSKKKEKQNVMCCVDCASNVEVVDEEDEEDDDWGEVEEDDEDEESEDRDDSTEEDVDEEEEDEEEEEEDEVLDDDEDDDDFFDDDDDEDEDDDFY